MGILDDVPLKVGDFYVPIDFMTLDMAEDACTQSILGRPFLVTAGCKIDVKEGRLTFDVKEKHAEFGLFKYFESAPPSTYSCCGCDMIGLKNKRYSQNLHKNFYIKRRYSSKATQTNERYVSRRSSFGGCFNLFFFFISQMQNIPPHA